MARAFEPDLMRLRKRGVDLEPLWGVVEAIRGVVPSWPAIAITHSPETGKGFATVTILPDWVMIYALDDETLYLTRTGTHSDLFG